jgi:4-diphosphocytidyl-2C-methyl-D-erythritol kinase
MSGTGASVFALFDDFDLARDVARRVPPDWRCFCAFRRNRSPLLDFLTRAGARGEAQG